MDPRAFTHLFVDVISKHQIAGVTDRSVYKGCDHLRRFSQHMFRGTRRFCITNAQLIIWSKSSGLIMSLANEGITAWPENYRAIFVTCGPWASRFKHTPAMNNPKATPNLAGLLTPNDVSAGLQRLPGDSRFENPSMRITAMMRSVEMMPSIDE